MLSSRQAGGGIPVTRDRHGHLQGVEAVIDKDLTSSLCEEPWCGYFDHLNGCGLGDVGFGVTDAAAGLQPPCQK